MDEIKPSTIDVKEKLRAVCFLGDFVLVGTNSGVVKVRGPCVKTNNMYAIVIFAEQQIQSDNRSILFRVFLLSSTIIRTEKHP